MWESKVDIYRVFELRCKVRCYFGVGALNKISDIADWMKKNDIDKIIVVSDRNAYKVTGAWNVVEPILRKFGIGYILYDEVSPNPTVDQVDKATEMAKNFGAKAVVGIGGGSPLDTAKSVAVLLEYTNKNARQLYEGEFEPEKARPIVLVNTTHGTGTEVDRFAVASILEKNYKPALAYDCLYPTFSIDDPALMKTLPYSQTLYTSIDAVNHVTEAATTLYATPYTILLAKETIRLVAKYLPQALAHPDDLTARYYLLYASAIAGICFDNGLLHFTHALEHPLSALKPELPHGLGLAMLLPAVLKYIYHSVPEVLAQIYEPIVPGLKGVPGEAEKIAAKVEEWLFNLGIASKLEDEGFTKNDVEKLVKLAKTTPSLDLLLNSAPIKATDEVIRNIYTDSLKPLS